MDDNHDKGPLIIGAIAAALVMAFLLADRYLREKPPSVPLASTVSEPKPPQPPPQLGPPISEAKPQAAQQPPGTTVFECIKDGQRVFSDSPCGKEARTRTISPMNVMDAPRSVYRGQSASRSVESRREDNEETALARDCKPYEDEVKRIDAVMRQGYTSANGERLRGARRNAATLRDGCYRQR